MTVEPQGRELDRGLAKLMGWTDLVALPPHFGGYLAGLPTGTSRPANGGTSNHHVVPHYSTDLTAAMELAEAMRERGFTVFTSSWAGWEPVEHLYHAAMFTKDGDEDSAEADILPEAIAKAAFRALKGASDE